MLDLQLFLSRRLVLGRQEGLDVNFATDFVVGSLSQEQVERHNEWVNKLIEEDADLERIQSVAVRGEKQYNRSRNAASAESAKRAKQVLANPSLAELHVLFTNEVDETQVAKENMLTRVSSFRPQETIFEIGKRSTSDERAELMRKLRKKFEPRRLKASAKSDQNQSPGFTKPRAPHDQADGVTHSDNLTNKIDSASESELEVFFSEPTKRSNATDSWQDSENFISYTPRESNLAEERGYSVQSGSKNNTAEFLLQARGATMDLTKDETEGFGEANKPKSMRWDKKRKKYIMRGGDEDGPQGKKLIRGESGQKIAASFRSGRFAAWKRSHKIDNIPKVGETEKGSSGFRGNITAKGFRHKTERAPKEADRFRDDYHKQRKKVAEAKEKRVGKFKHGAGKNELRSVDDVRKQRRLTEKRREKNARPSKKRRL